LSFYSNQRVLWSHIIAATVPAPGKNCYNPFKGIVSRDLHIFFWYHSIDLTFLPFGSMFLCFLDFVFVSNFSIFASRHSELTLWVELAFSPSPGLKGKIFSYLFYVGNSKYGAAMTVSIFKIFPPKQHLHEPRSELPVRGKTQFPAKKK
jgi:hypothetical protein